jgi:hypothetical protein
MAANQNAAAVTAMCAKAEGPPRVVQQVAREAVVTTGTIMAMTTTFRPMEQLPSPQRVPSHFTSAMRFDDLSQFYGQTEGVTPFSEDGGSGTSQIRAFGPPEGDAIIDLNISAVGRPSPTPATKDLNPNGLQIHSPPPKT